MEILTEKKTEWEINVKRNTDKSSQYICDLGNVHKKPKVKKEKEKERKKRKKRKGKKRKRKKKPKEGVSTEDVLFFCNWILIEG